MQLVQLDHGITIRSIATEFSPSRQRIQLDVGISEAVAREWMPFLHAHVKPENRFYFVPRQPWVLSPDPQSATVLFQPFLEAATYDILFGLCHRDDPLKRLRIGEIDGMIRAGTYDVPEIDIAAASAQLSADDIDLHRIASEAQLSLFLDQKRRLCTWPIAGPHHTKVAAISIPKAGTYLVANLLERLGFQSSRIHASLGHTEDYRNFGIAHIAAAYRVVDISYSSRLVLPGQYMPTHIERNLASRVALADFAKLFIRRELRQTLVSAFRELLRYRDKEQYAHILSESGLTELGDDTEKAFAAWLSARGDQSYRAYLDVIGWFHDSEVTQLAFEDIVGDMGAVAQLSALESIARACGLAPTTESLRSALSQSVWSDSMTFSGQRSSLDGFWSPNAEERFSSFGFAELNRQLGYG
jgi:hypothetical protein